MTTMLVIFLCIIAMWYCSKICLQYQPSVPAFITSLQYQPSVSVLSPEAGYSKSIMRWCCDILFVLLSSTKRLEKSDADEKSRTRRAASPTLPDGDLPSYMKATESYFKKVVCFDVYPLSSWHYSTFTMSSTSFVVFNELLTRQILLFFWCSILTSKALLCFVLWNRMEKTRR